MPDRKKTVAVAFFRGMFLLFAGSILACSMAACSPLRESPLVEIENREEQYEKMEQELEDLKEIKIKRVSAKRWEQLHQKLYEHYFRNKDDKKHIEVTEDEDSGDIIYRTEDTYEILGWGEYGISYSADFREEDVLYYEDTDEEVIEEEVEKLFKVLGLEYNNKENGYAIGKIAIQGDNAREVHIKRYIGGKELSMAGNRSMDTVDNVEVTFGDNQIIGVFLQTICNVVEITDGKEVLVDSPQKACKLLANYINSWGYGKMKVNTLKLTYMPVSEEDGVYTLGPVADFYTEPEPDSNVKVEQVYQVDLATKEVDTNFYCSYYTVE